MVIIEQIYDEEFSKQPFKSAFVGNMQNQKETVSEILSNSDRSDMNYMDESYESYEFFESENFNMFSKSTKDCNANLSWSGEMEETTTTNTSTEEFQKNDQYSSITQSIQNLTFDSEKISTNGRSTQLKDGVVVRPQINLTNFLQGMISTGEKLGAQGLYIDDAFKHHILEALT